MTFIDATQFREYFNKQNISINKFEEFGVIVENSDISKSVLLMKSKQNYDLFFTIEFKLFFEHKKSKENKVIQKEFSIEHHPENKSTHTKPHLQFHIHGPDNRVGEMWIILDLDEDDDYVSCIKGFFYILEEIIKNCECGLETKMLNLSEVQKLVTFKEKLLLKVFDSLNNKRIEFKNLCGEKIIPNSETIKPLLKKDETLLPFFS